MQCAGSRGCRYEGSAAVSAGEYKLDSRESVEITCRRRCNEMKATERARAMNRGSLAECTDGVQIRGRLDRCITARPVRAAGSEYIRAEEISNELRLMPRPTERGDWRLYTATTRPAAPHGPPSTYHSRTLRSPRYRAGFKGWRQGARDPSIPPREGPPMSISR